MNDGPSYPAMEQLFSSEVFKAVFEGVCTRAIIVNKLYDESAFIYIFLSSSKITRNNHSIPGS